MRPGPGVCPSCSKKIPRAAIRCVYCNMWLAVEILHTPGESAMADSAAPSRAKHIGATYGSVIYLTPADFAKLEYLATIARNPRTDALAEALVDKLACAVIVPARDLPVGVMTINRAARIVVADGVISRRRVVVLRNSDDSDDDDPDTVSVMSQLGLALLGMTTGCSAIFRGLDGVSRTVTVERVLDSSEHAATRRAAAPNGDDPGPTAA